MDIRQNAQEFFDGVKSSDANFAICRSLYKEKIKPAFRVFHDFSEEERHWFETQARQYLESVRADADEKSYFAIVVSALSVLRNPMYWERRFEALYPKNELFDSLQSALELSRMQINNPYRQIVDGIYSFIGGKEEQAIEKFHVASNMKSLRSTVHDSLRGVATVMPIPHHRERQNRDSDISKPVEIFMAADVDSTKPLYTFFGDDIYFRAFSLSILQSLIDNAEEAKNVLFHVINLTDEGQRVANLLREIAAETGHNVCVTHEYNPEASRTYFATARFFQIGKILDLFKCDIILSDLDVEFIKNIDRYHEYFEKDSLSLVLAQGPYWGFLPWRQVYAGHMYIPNSASGHEFAKLLASYVDYLWHGHAKPEWWLDQCALWYVKRELERYNQFSQFFHAKNVHAEYMQTGETLKVAGLQKIDGIMKNIESGENWHAALVKAQSENSSAASDP